jgi:hypothetical protein
MKWLFSKHKRLPQDNRIKKYEMINHKMHNNVLQFILTQKSMRRKITLFGKLCHETNCQLCEKIFKQVLNVLVSDKKQELLLIWQV